MRRKDREISEHQEFEDIIRKADVCRIALTNNNIPYIVTLNFGYVSEPEKLIYFHCANQGRKLDMIRQNNNVCFEMDIDHEIYKGARGCDWGSRFRSIVGYGEIDIITQKNDKITGLKSIMSHYGGEGEYEFEDSIVDNTTILRLRINEMSAKKK